MTTLLIAATVLELAKNGIGFKVESDSEQIDPAKSVFLRVEAVAPQDRVVELPDLRDRVVGFSLAEDFVEEPRTEKDGSTVKVANWRLVPEPCADAYKIRPFVVKASPRMLSYQTDEGRYSFVAGPIKFEPPAAREPVTGEMECDPTKDLPPLSWKLVGWIAAALLTILGLLGLLAYLVKYLARRVREHRMSPIERAWVELDRLRKKGLPGRGRYKDFYVELTMVVRRYVQRQHGVKAPHLTTEEFFETTRNSPSFPKNALNELMDFLRKADMVKFAGVEATPETADGATESARNYMAKDSALCGPASNSKSDDPGSPEVTTT